MASLASVGNAEKRITLSDRIAGCVSELGNSLARIESAVSRAGCADVQPGTISGATPAVPDNMEGHVQNLEARARRFREIAECVERIA